MRTALGLVALTPLLAAAGFFSSVPLLLPVMCAAPAYAAMALMLSRGRRGAAVAAMLVWAVGLALTMTLLIAWMPERAANVVLHGPAYWREMGGWLETGQGRESRPAEFLPQHLLHAGLFVVLSLATGSVVSIVFGAVLMNYMAYYVAHVALLTPSHPVLAGILGWHPWSVLRVASFVVLGVLLAEPVLSRVQGRARPIGSGWRWIGLACAGLAADVLLKSALAPHWAALLRALR